MENRLKIIVSLVVLAVLLALFNLANFANPLRNFFYSISSPFQRFFKNSGDNFSDFWAGMLEAQDLKRENEILQSRVRELVGEKLRLETLRKENETLREVLNLGLEKDFDLKLAKVVSQDVSQDSLLLNLGRDDGIVSGLPAINSQKVLVGKIGEVFKNFSKVVLASAKDNAFDIRIGETQEVFGVAKGRGSYSFAVELVPREKEVSPGDFVFTSSLGDIFPPNLLVGQVETAAKDDVEPFQKIKAKTAFEFSNLDNVFIIFNFQGR